MPKVFARVGAFAAHGVFAGLLLGVPRVAAAEPPPAAAASAPPDLRLQWEHPIYCTRDARGRTLHLQRQTGFDGVARLAIAKTENDSGEELDRLRDCSGWSTVRAQNTDHLPIAPAIAEAPPGWYRDEQGRVFQVTFDMLKRFYLGAGYSPVWGDPGRTLGRMRLETGLVASWFDPEERHRRNIEALTGDVSIPDVRVRGQLFAYELDRATPQPFVRLTTFFGRPRRRDLTMNVGFGLRVLDVEYRPHRTTSALDVEYGRVYGNWALWYSPDMASHVLLRAGAGAGNLRDGAADKSASYLAPVGGFEARFLLDHAGFHQLKLDGRAQLPVYVSGSPATKVRVGGVAAYELILVAVNDQPLTLRTEGAVSYRNDLPEPGRQLDVQALAGLRFSFWTPGRTRERLAVPKASAPGSR